MISELDCNREREGENIHMRKEEKKDEK